MKRYLIFGLILFGVVGCVIPPVKSSDENKSIDSNSSKKTLIVDLDKELEKDYSKGGLRGKADKIIPVIIFGYMGDNDEVAFQGEVLKRAKKIKVGDNDEVAFSGQEYTIKTSELKDKDLIYMIDANGTTFVTMKVREY